MAAHVPGATGEGEGALPEARHTLLPGEESLTIVGRDWVFSLKNIYSTKLTDNIE